MKTMFKIKGIFGILFMFCLTAAYPQQMDDSITEKIYQDYKEKGVDEALKAFKKSPEYGKEYSDLGEPLNVVGYRIMGMDKDLDAAEKVFMAQIKEYPDEANPLDSYGDLLLAKGDKEKAIKYFKKSIDKIEAKGDNEENSLLAASKSKLAKLEGRGSALKFALGTWNMERFNIEDGKKSAPYKGTMTFAYNEDDSILTSNMHDEAGTYRGTRIIAYDALDDNYDLIYAGGEAMRGLMPSTLIIKEDSPEKLVFIEKYTEDGKEMKAKHILTKADNNVTWDINEISDDNKENPVVAMNITKKN